MNITGADRVNLFASAKDLYFECRLIGATRDYVVVESFPRNWQLVRGRGRLTFIDQCCFCEDKGSVSAFMHSSILPGTQTGMTMILFEGVPIWVMHYGGVYEMDAMKVLQFALMSAWEEKKFQGGRGLHLSVSKEGKRVSPDQIQHAFIAYFNRPVRNDFEDFEGTEEIVCIGNPSCLGRGWYKGMALI